MKLLYIPTYNNNNKDGATIKFSWNIHFLTTSESSGPIECHILMNFWE